MGRAADIADRVRESFPDVTTEPGVDCDVIVVPAEAIVDTLRIAKDEFGFDLLSDVMGVDWLPREPRYDVNYHVTRIEDADRIRVKVRLAGEESPKVPSVCDVHPGANFHEREVYDFFGIVFTGHPDLRRILMPDEWVGHPLRKDYPVGGVPVEYRIEPHYIGENVVPDTSRPAAGGVPVRLRRDRGRLSDWTWTGPPATGVRVPAEPGEPSPEGEEA